MLQFRPLYGASKLACEAYAQTYTQLAPIVDVATTFFSFEDGLVGYAVQVEVLLEIGKSAR